MKSVTANEGSEITLAENTFTKNGYTFAGWNTTADGKGEKIADKAKIKLTANTTLYAQWTASDYKITYNLDGGTNAEGNPDGYNAETETITLQSPTKTGYAFAGWYKDSKFENKVTEIANGSTGDVTLYAKWEVINYTVTFDKNADDATGDVPAEIQVTYDVEFELPENTFTKIGYNFAGWNTKADGSGTNYEAKSSVNNLTAENGATVTLYAKWTAIVYSITYELDGGTNADDNPASYTIEDSITLKEPTKDGFTFVCWYSDRSKKTEIAKGSTGDIVLQAVWKDNANFVKVPAVSINGSETWIPDSEVFVKGRTLNIKAFLMSDHEVTQAEWKAVMETTPSDLAKAYDKDGNELTGNAADNNPVNMVSWYDAIVYCNKRSIKEGLTPCYTIKGSTDPDKWGDVPILPREDTWKDSVTCDFTANGYRLPTEADWDWAVRGGENYTYAGSNTVDEVAWYTGNTNDTGTREVKTLKANGYGLYDMSGNVREWCWDWYNSDSDTPSRCLRDGSCYGSANFCEAAYRRYNFPVDRSRGTGFRVVRTAEE